MSKTLDLPVLLPSLTNTSLKLDFPKSTSEPINVPSVPSVTYPMLGTRPDLAHTAAALGCHAANPAPNRLRHSTTPPFVTCGPQATADQQFVYQRGAPGSSTLLGYVGTDWTSDVNNCKSMSCYAFVLRCTPPGLRGRVGDPAAGDAQRTNTDVSLPFLADTMTQCHVVFSLSFLAHDSVWYT